MLSAVLSSFFFAGAFVFGFATTGVLAAAATGVFGFSTDADVGDYFSGDFPSFSNYDFNRAFNSKTLGLIIGAVDGRSAGVFGFSFTFFSTIDFF